MLGLTLDILRSKGVGIGPGGGGTPSDPGYTPPLDTYTDAAAAYSVRLLRTAYSGSSMRVRRFVPPYDEKDIGFTPAGDLDEAAIVAFGGSDELRVSVWYDQSGNSRHATQNTPNSQPQIYNGTAVITENGKPTLKMVASDTLATSASFSSLTEGEAFIAVRWLGDTSSTGGFKIGTHIGAQHFPYLGGQVYDNFGSTTRRNFNPSVSLNQLNLYNPVSTSSEWTARLNSNVENTSATNTVGFSTLSIGTVQMDHVFSEFILFDSAKSTSDRTGIETDIMTYFSIT